LALASFRRFRSALAAFAASAILRHASPRRCRFRSAICPSKSGMKSSGVAGFAFGSRHWFARIEQTSPVRQSSRCCPQGSSAE